MMTRRRFLRAGTTLALCTLPFLASAGSSIRLLRGPVFVDNRRATSASTIDAVDSIAVGNGGAIEFVLGSDALYLGARSLLQFGHSATTNELQLRLVSGNLLASLAERRQELVVDVPGGRMTTRGGALFIQAGGLQAYMCTCYGSSTISTDENATPVVATHHTAYTMNRRNDQAHLVASSGGQGHVDADVRRLAAYVGRESPASFNAAD